MRSRRHESRPDDMPRSTSIHTSFEHLFLHKSRSKRQGLQGPNYLDVIGLQNLFQAQFLLRLGTFFRRDRFNHATRVAL